MAWWTHHHSNLSYLHFLPTGQVSKFPCVPGSSVKQQILTGDLSTSTAHLIFNPHSGFVAGLSDRSQQKDCVSVCLCRTPEGRARTRMLENMRPLLFVLGLLLLHQTCCYEFIVEERDPEKVSLSSCSADGI